MEWTGEPEGLSSWELLFIESPRYGATCFTWIMPFNSKNSLKKWAPLVSLPFSRWKNWGFERLSNDQAPTVNARMWTRWTSFTCAASVYDGTWQWSRRHTWGNFNRSDVIVLVTRPGLGQLYWKKRREQRCEISLSGSLISGLGLECFLWKLVLSSVNLAKTMWASWKTSPPNFWSNLGFSRFSWGNVLI